MKDVIERSDNDLYEGLSTALNELLAGLEAKAPAD